MSGSDETESVASDGSGGLLLSSARGRWVVAATVLGSGITLIDSTVVGIALPTIGRDFHTALGPMQWVVTGYTLTLAAFLLLGGSLGDRYGRKKLFMIGIAWFAIASAACGLAPDAGVLIATRILQGIGGALLTPGSLAIIQASFTSDDRARAIGAWSGFGGLAAAAGPLLGGYLISAVSWRWIFFINLPISLLVLAVSARHVPESKDPSAGGSLDLAGAALAIVSLAAINYALIEGSSNGWGSGLVIAAAVVAVVATVIFFVVERSEKDPMLRLDIFKNREFAATNAVTFVVYAGLGGALFLLPIELQVVLGYSPLEAGISLLPLTLIMLFFSARSGKLAARIGPRLQMSVGPIIVGVGLALLVTATHGRNYFEYVMPAVIVFAIGLATTVAPLTSTAMGSVPSEHSGMASAINNDVARIAGLVAVALLPWLSGITGTSYLHASELASEFRTAMIISGAVCVVGGLISAAEIRNPSSRNKEAAHAARASHVGGRII
jgi:EmrB/QacA subfamily drug resistance transporter